MAGVKPEDLPVRLFGPVGAVLAGDVTIFDRWLWLRRRLRSGRVRTLDAGSGSGAFAIYAATRGNEVVGISFDQRNNEVARRRADLAGVKSLELVQGDLRKLDAMAEELGTFDQIICQETIEHIGDDDKLVRDLSALLRPGGLLFLTTPSAEHRPVYGELEQHNWREDGGHVRFGYTRDRLREMLEASGLEVVDEDGVSGVLSQWTFSLGAWLAMRARLPVRATWALTFPLRVLRIADRALTRFTGRPYFSVAVVARKA